MYPLIHYIIPTLLLLFLFKSDKKLVFFLTPLTLLSDLDYFTNLHRLLLHNIFFIILVSCLSYLFLKKLFKIENKKEVFFVIIFLLVSHLVLDFDNYGVGLLYPFDYHLLGFDFHSFNFVFKEFKDGLWFNFNLQEIPKKEVVFIITLQLIFWYRSISDYYKNKLIKSKVLIYFIEKVNNLSKTVNI